MIDDLAPKTQSQAGSSKGDATDNEKLDETNCRMCAALIKASISGR